MNAPHMREAITREPGGDSIPIRVIHVPTEIHMSMPHHKVGEKRVGGDRSTVQSCNGGVLFFSQAHPIFEHTAENIAFRRARGKFILKTNIDNILSPFTAAWTSTSVEPCFFSCAVVALPWRNSKMTIQQCM